MQPAVTNTHVSYTVPDDVTVNTVPRSSLPAIFIGERLIVYGILHQRSQPANTPEGTICLTGDLLGAKIEHIMKFQVPPAVTKENMLQVSTIHHLAAKKLIKELESGNGSRSNPEIIQLSCDSNVISSQTAFIAIDEERKEAVKGSLQSWDIHEDLEFGSDYSRCRSSAMNRLRTRSQDLFGATKILYTPRSAAKSAKRIPTFSLLEMASEGKSASNYTKFAPVPAVYDPLSMAAVCMYGPPSYMSAPETKSLSKGLRHSSSASRASNPVSTITNLQLASGAWKLTSELADVIEKTTAEIKDACPVSCQGEMETTWATTIVLSYLHLRQSHFKDEWELVAMKAESWLTKQSLPEGCSLHVLREKAEAFLSYF